MKQQQINEPTKDDIEFSEQATSLIEKEELSDNDILVLITDVLLPFANMLAPYPLYDYQEQIFIGICYSVIRRKGHDITVLISRQGGKSYTIAVTIAAMGILLPAIAKFFKAKQIKRFSDKFRVGVYGPDYDKAGIIYERIKEVLTNERALHILASPEFDIDEKEIKGLSFSNGFSVDLRTANKNSKLEGFTYELLITDETQDIDGYILGKSLSPMRAATGGSMVHIGTPIPKTCYFSDACFRHGELDRKENAQENIARRHYEFNYQHPARNNELYAQSIEQEKDRLGEYSDEFRMAYNIEWLQSRGILISHDELKKGAIEKTKIVTAKVVKPGSEPYKTEFKQCAHIVSSDIHTPDQVFSIDFGKMNDSTVMTTAKVWWENPSLVGDEYRYPIHINDWFEIVGSDHEIQHPELHKEFRKFNLCGGIVDATGRGDPIYSRLQGELVYKGIDVNPFIFTAQSKHEGYLLLKQEINAGRVTFPYSKTVRTYKKHQEFMKQLSNLVKEYKGVSNYMRVSHPNISGYHDDYADSLMMLVWMVNKIGRGNVNILTNMNAKGSSRFLRDIHVKARMVSNKSMPKIRNWR